MRNYTFIIMSRAKSLLEYSQLISRVNCKNSIAANDILINKTL